jgi:hypothetical protein
MPARARTLAPAVLAIAAIYAVATALVLSGIAAQHPAIPPAIAFDLTITAAFACWWLAVRPGHLRARALVRVVAIGFVAAKLLVGFQALGLAGMVAEAAVLGLLATRIHRVVRRTRAERRAGASIPAALDTAFTAVLPRRLGAVLATEVAAVWLALGGWFARPPASTFTMHRASGAVAILGVLLGLVAVETVGTHLVLAVAVSPTVALIATALSSYGALWLVGALHAIRLGGIRVLPDVIVIEKGLRARVIVPRAAIASATPITSAPAEATDLGYVAPNLVLALREPVTVHGLFGRLTTTRAIALTVDDRDAFVAALDR